MSGESSANNGEQAPLLGAGPSLNLAKRNTPAARVTIYGCVTLLFVIALVLAIVFWENLGGFVGNLPKDPEKAAKRLLEVAPIIVSLTYVSCIKTDDNILIRMVILVNEK